MKLEHQPHYQTPVLSAAQRPVALLRASYHPRDHLGTTPGPLDRNKIQNR